MPLTSQAQRRFFHAAEADGKLPKGTAARWEAHTPKGKKLPERIAEEKRAFVREFLLKCAAIGATEPEAIAVAAEELARTTTKKAFFGEVLGGASHAAGGVTGAALGLGSYGLAAGVAAPLILGGGLGAIGATIHNAADKDDAKSLRMAALANAYRRRAAEANMNSQVRRVVESDPSKYVVLG